MEVVIKGDAIEIAEFIKELQTSQDVQQTTIRTPDGAVQKITDYRSG